MKNSFYLLLILHILSFSLAKAQSFRVTEMATVPMKISNNAVSEAFVNGLPYVYSFAGIDSTKDHKGIGLWSFRYNTITDVWDSISPLPDTLGKIAASANRVKDLIYIIGGYHVFDDGSELSSDKVHIYDPSNNLYLPDGAAVPVPIDDQTQAVWRDSLIFVITGWSQIRNVTDVQIYNPALNTWTAGTPVPNFGNFRSFGSSGIIVGDTIFYFGGASSNSIQNFPIQNSLRIGIIDANDPSIINWTDTVLDSNLRGYRMACTTVQGNIHWIGGSNRTYNYDGLAYSNGQGVEPLNRNLFLEPETLKWDTDSAIGADFPMDLRGLGEVSPLIRYIVGGMDSGQVVSNKTLKLEFVKNSFDLNSSKILEFKVYPNPTEGLVKVFIADEEDYELILFNALGQSLELFQFRNHLNIDLEKYENGLYFLVEKESGQSFKILKF